ncbi:MAG: hypothetical protein CM1200mP22_33100 [Dehalococcoidia bacterium]|nr:MAG: hypothetical protein CM1200mP22_33100 [Dehalococcoidia bacterium]
MNQRRGVRWSATKAFLRPVFARQSYVLTNAHAQKIVIEDDSPIGKRATGVEVRMDNGEF